VKELTERIPKTAWLTRVRISGSQVNIEGYAASATALVQVLEASRYFRNVEFSSPTFRDPQMGMDRFQIKMEITERKKEAAADEKK
jgi:Tfp pilus assembly protein PilN